MNEEPRRNYAGIQASYSGRHHGSVTPRQAVHANLRATALGPLILLLVLLLTVCLQATGGEAVDVTVTPGEIRGASPTPAAR